MTTDFSKYNDLIEQFRGAVTSASFEAEFSSATQNLAKPEKFLLKMELKRLAQPCTRLIDLRGLVDGECQAYEHDGRIHFLDDIAIRVFEENLTYYNGYTFGVYDAAMNTENNFRVIYQREKAEQPLSNSTSVKKENKVRTPEQTDYSAELISFGPYHNRIEERMNFAISLEVMFSKSDKQVCTSSDISANGCRFRIKKMKNIDVGQELLIRFVGLEEEFEFGDETQFVYEVRNVEKISSGQLIGVERIYKQDKRQDSFYRFLSKFIQGNKRRYKINLDNTISAVRSRAYEQFFLPKINELPVFLQENEKGLAPNYCLTCHDNRLVFEYWQDEKKRSTLHYLLSKQRLKQLQALRESGESLLVYSFVHMNQGQSYFYTADQQQLLEDPEFCLQFLGFAASKDSFAISQLSLIDCLPDNAESLLTLADSLEKKDAYLTQAYSKDVTDILEKLPYILVVNDITTTELVKQYQEYSFEGITTARLKEFGHRRVMPSVDATPVGISYCEQRKEPRFFYNTPVKVAAGKVAWSGASVDFSISGMKVELSKPAILRKGDIVSLTFPKLQKNYFVVFFE